MRQRYKRVPPIHRNLKRQDLESFSPEKQSFYLCYSICRRNQEIKKAKEVDKNLSWKTCILRSDFREILKKRDEEKTETPYPELN